MRVTAQIPCDLLMPANNIVDAVRGDSNSRTVACRLLEEGLPWTPPASAQVRVSYTLPDGTPGLYETLPDGSPAGTISGSTVTILLPDPILTAVGCSDVSVMLLDESGAQLSTFPFRVRVSGGSDLQNPSTWPQMGAEFEGKLVFVSGGTVTPLKLGPGLRIENGVLYVAGGAGEPDVEIPVTVTTGEDGTILVSPATLVLDSTGTITASVPVTLADDGTIIIGGDNNG